MYRELLTFAVMYALALVAHSLHGHAGRRRAHRREVQATLAARRGVRAYLRRHVLALCVATASHPVTHATVKEYIIHLVVYSGYVIPH